MNPLADILPILAPIGALIWLAWLAPPIIRYQRARRIDRRA